MHRSSLSWLPLAAVLGCASQQPTDTFETTLDAAARAMAEGRAEALYAMLGEKQKVGMSVASLAADLERNHAEFAELAEDIAHPVDVRFEAVIALDGHEDLLLVEQDGVWKLDMELFEEDVPTDPVHVLGVFSDELASLAQDLAESAVLAERHEDGILATLRTLAAEIAAVRAEDLVLSEDRCYVDLPSGHKVELVKEEEVWKVFSVFPPLTFK
jgi:hypothetical protein